MTPTSPELQSLVKRLKKLEHQMRQAALKTKTLETQKLILRDMRGNVRARLVVTRDGKLITPATPELEAVVMRLEKLEKQVRQTLLGSKQKRSSSATRMGRHRRY